MQEKKSMEDLKSTYTHSAIETCNNFKFILLLLKNYSRNNPDSELIEAIILKISE